VNASVELRPVLCPRLTLPQLLTAGGGGPFASVEELSGEAGTPDPELEEFLISYRAERQRNVS